LTRRALVVGGTGADDEYFGLLLDYAAEDRRLELRQSE
jgi:hypothetical protein